MARLDFEFRTQQPRFNKLGWGLLLAGMTAMAWTWMNYQAARATDAGLALQIANIEKTRSHAVSRSIPRSDDGARSAQARVAAQLAYSWQPAFDALAAARTSKIALVSLDASQAKSKIELVAEARKLADAVEFIDVLQQQPGVKSATLIRHEVQDTPAQHPVRFNIVVELGT